jgi:hypothetical protein
MISQNEAVTKDHSINIETWRQERGCQPDRMKSATTTVSSFPGRFQKTLDVEQTVALTDSTGFVKEEIQAGEEVNVRADHEQADREEAARFARFAENPGPRDVKVCGEVTISLSSMEVHRGGQLVALTRKEFKTLAYLLKNARRVVSRDELLNEVWGYECYPCTRTVDNHILRLRKKLEREPARPKHFRTVHGTGYKFLP